MQISCLQIAINNRFLSGIKGEVQYHFKSRLALSFEEKDTTGFSSQYGWVHAFAHGADLLTEE